MQSYPIDSMNFFMKYGEVMSQITSAEVFYGADLREVSRELGSLYWRWAKDLLSRKSNPQCFDDLRKLEFKAQCKTCEDVIRRSSALVKDLDRLFLVDTSQMNAAIEKARIQKVSAERTFSEQGKLDEGIQSMKTNVDDIFKAYSDWQARRRNLERNALLKWLGGFGALYLPAMVIYFQVLNYMQVKPDFTLGVFVPVVTAMFGFLLLFAIFSRE